MKQTKALVLFSGGIDSSVVLWWARAQGWDCSTLSFKFPSRRKQEMAAEKKLAALAKVSRRYALTLPFVEDIRPERACRIAQRNLMYYGIAASLAEQIGASIICGGHIAHDQKIFKDARIPFFKQLEKLVNRSSINPIKFVFPLIKMRKKAVILLGKKLQVPFEYTWSCSHQQRRPCGACKSCKEKETGFREAGIKL